MNLDAFALAILIEIVLLTIIFWILDSRSKSNTYEKKDRHDSKPIKPINEKSDQLNKAIILAYEGRTYSVDELAKFGDQATDILYRMAEKNNFLAPDELIKLKMALGNHSPGLSWWSVLNKMAWNGFVFTTDQLLQYGDFPENEKNAITPIPISLVLQGHFFTCDDIILLKNPTDELGASMAHWQARLGYQFTIDDLIRLGDIRINYSKNDLYYFDIMVPIVLTIADFSEDEEYSKKCALLHNGATVAHIMAREGYKFTDEEIEKLGDPRDAEGLSLKDWMEKAVTKAETQKV